jgi:hypothetical protein
MSGRKKNKKRKRNGPAVSRPRGDLEEKTINDQI